MSETKTTKKTPAKTAKSSETKKTTAKKPSTKKTPEKQSTAKTKKVDPILAARALGRAIQEDEKYTEYRQAKKDNDEDEALQKAIGEFNLTKQRLQMELTKSSDDTSREKIDELNKKLQENYKTVMTNKNMARFTIAKAELDTLISNVTQIINLCCEGEDPETCQPSQGCGPGGCSSCAGCH